MLQKIKKKNMTKNMRKKFFSSLLFFLYSY